jgi:hypothetical protein
MPTQKAVSFMNPKTPGNFQGKRQQHEVRALALRAASFSRPNRKKKSKKVAAKDVKTKDVESKSREEPVNSSAVPVDNWKESPVSVSPGRINPSSYFSLLISRVQEVLLSRVQTVSGKFYCFFCGKPLNQADGTLPPDVNDQPSLNTNSNVSWHQTCTHFPSTNRSNPSDIQVINSTDVCDPFDTTPLPLTTEALAILNYIRKFTYAVNWPDELAVCRPGGSLFKAHEAIYRKYFIHPAPMNAYLSYVYNLMAIAQPEKAVYYRAKSMKYSVECFRELRVLINALDQSPEQLMVIVQTIWPLTSAEHSESVRNGGDRSFQHRRALRRLLQLLGGINQLPQIYKELFVQFFAKIAILKDTVTEIDPLDWDPGPWPALDREAVGSPPPKPSTQATPQTTDSVILSDLFPALRELIKVEKLKRRGTWSDQDHLGPVFRWTFLRKLTLKMRFWNLLQSAEQEDRSHRLTSTEVCLCLAAQLLIYLSFETRPVRQPWCSAPSQYAQLLERFKSLNAANPDCSHPRLTKPSSHRTPSKPPKNHCATDSDANHLLWIAAVGVAFEEEMHVQNLETGLHGTTLRITATAAGFYDQEACRSGTSGADEDDEIDNRPAWFARNFKRLAHGFGYVSPEEVRASFAQEHVYDEIIMDGILHRSFAGPGAKNQNFGLAGS